MSKIKGKQLTEIPLFPSDTPLSIDSYTVSATGSGKQLVNKDFLENSIPGTNSLQQVTDVGNITTNDVEITTSFTRGVILRAPDDTRWRLTVNNHGQVLTTSLNDVDAELFISAYSITNETETNALNQFVIDLKGEGYTPNGSNLWSDIFIGVTGGAIYPFIGGNSMSHTGNLINPGSFDLTFIGSQTHSSTGVEFSGTNSYATTGIIPITHLIPNDFSFSVYLRDNIPHTSAAMGAQTSGTSRLKIFPRISINARFDANTGNTTNGSFQTSNTDSSSLITGTRRSISDVELFRNGNSLGIGTASNTGSLPTIEIYIASNNLSGSSSGYYLNEFRLASISKGMTTIQLIDWNNAVQRFQTTLGRAV